MYAKNLLNLLDLLLQEEGLKIDREDDVIVGCLLTHGGELVHESTAKALSA
jgi:NAD(P) transhydrogenase subunit alpha